MTLEAVYWLTLGVGLGMLVLSLLVGDVLDLFDLELGGNDVAAGPVFFAAIAAFGAGGLLGIRAFELGSGGSILVGLGTGGVFAVATAMLFMMLRRQEAEGSFDLAGMVGERAQVTVRVGPGEVGRVSITYQGMTRAFAARSDQDIAVGEEVVVRDVIGSQMSVSRPAATPEG